MISVNKKKIEKRYLSLIITAGILAVLILAAVILNVVINAMSDGDANQGPTLELQEGESSSLGYPTCYPSVQNRDIIYISVDSHKENFIMSRYSIDSEGEKRYDDYFMLSYEDDNGNQKLYYPGILTEEPDTSYAGLYAVETADGYNITKMEYICSILGTLYFDQRIELGEDRNEQILRYGLGVHDRETVYFQYLGSDGKTRDMKIHIGDSLITGVGFYFMIEGRDCIYTSASSERFEYVLGDIESFLHSRVVAEGLTGDGIYEPYLTTDYKQWTNVYHSNDGGIIPVGSEVIALTNILTPIYKADGLPTPAENEGYRSEGKEIMSIDLKYISQRPEFDALRRVLEGNRVGKYTDSPLVVSVISNVNEAKFGVKYTYRIYGVEAIITDNGDVSEKGVAVGDNNLVKIQYDYLIDGVYENAEICHAIVDLSDNGLLPEDIREGLKSAVIGERINLLFEQTYDQSNTYERKLQLVITDIQNILSFDDKGNATLLDKITENSTVTYKYKYLVNGAEIGKSGTSTVSLSGVTAKEDLAIKEALIGMGRGNDVNLTVYEETGYCQPFMDFVTYQIEQIKGCVEKQIVASFEYVNASERDPFYGESIYKNTLDNSNKYFAIDASACQAVTFLLGGVGSSTGTTNLSAGLVGKETVAIGLTPENLEKYGLYDGYTIYFELPRGIIRVGGSASNEVDDYAHLYTLGFTLYVSKPQSDGTRYLGSNMYDIIVKIDGEGFDYLEKSFEEYWARRNLVMIEYTGIDKISIDMSTEKIYGRYELDMSYKTLYSYDGQYYDSYVEGSAAQTFTTVNVTPLSENCSENAFMRILREENRKSMTLTNLYNRVNGSEDEPIGKDSDGTEGLKEMLRLLYGISYLGVMTEEEQNAAIELNNKIFSISFVLENSSVGYTYDFYRANEREVMVHIYRFNSVSGEVINNSSDEVSGFYVSITAARKIIGGFDSLLNGKTVDINDAYPV